MKRALKNFSCLNWRRNVTFFEFLPPFITFLISILILLVFISHHSIPLLRFNSSIRGTSQAEYYRGLAELVLCSIIYAGFFSSFFLALKVSPGHTPDTQEWKVTKEKLVEIQKETTKNYKESIEKKRAGGPRYCKWCLKFKPDRAHHCRVCKNCVLKMDHHCPWIANCVGWGNHKFFMLALVYGFVGTFFTSIIMSQYLINENSSYPGTSSADLLLTFIVLIDLLLSISLFGFLCFHFWLVHKGITCIEYCEKISARNDIRYLDLWDLGFSKNFTNVFGCNPLLWFVPYAFTLFIILQDNRKGNGLEFLCESAKLLSSESHSFEPLVE